MSTTDPGDRLREERERLGMSQEEFGAHGGVRKQAQHLYEKGVRKPDTTYLVGVAKLGVDVAYVLTGQRSGESVARQEIDEPRVSRVQEAARKVATLQRLVAEPPWADGPTEAKLLVDYRRCAPPDKRAIEHMAARLASDAPVESPTKKK